MKKPVVFEFLDISLYLREVYKFRKLHEKNFSYETWAHEIGFKSRAHLRSVVLGEQKPPQTLMPNFFKSLTLDEKEISYFVLLNQFSHADNEQIKNVFGRQLLYSWQKQLNEVKVTEIEGFLSDSIIPVVFTYLSFDNTSSEPEDISKDLDCELVRIHQALRCLTWQKLITSDVDERGKIKYKTTKDYFHIPSAHGNAAIRAFHAEGLEQAKQAIQLAPETRSFCSRFVALNENEYKEFQSYLLDYLDKLMVKHESATIQAKKIYRINFQVLPVSKTIDPENDSESLMKSLSEN